MNFLKCLRAPFLQNTSERLTLFWNHYVIQKTKIHNMTETRHLKKYRYFFQVAIVFILSFTQFMPMYVPIGLGNAPDQVLNQ